MKLISEEYDSILDVNFQKSIIGFISQLSSWSGIENLIVKAQEKEP
jgi:hypothetical protein